VRIFYFQVTASTIYAVIFMWALPVFGQYPGELIGRVVDSTTGKPIVDALIVLPASQLSDRSDGSGTFRLRGINPGGQSIRIEHLGYATFVGDILVHNGSISRDTYLLEPIPVSLDSLMVWVDHPLSVGVHQITSSEIQSSGARTAGDVLSATPSVIIRREGFGGAQTVSIRGSSADAVLVLLNGVPLNDPITGEADLSRIAARIIQDIRVVAGGATSRFGPGAEGGVIIIRTVGAPVTSRVMLGMGSLGMIELAGEGGFKIGKARLGIGVNGFRTDGEFSFVQSPEVGGLKSFRRNADEKHLTAWTSFSLPNKENKTQFRFTLESVRRGIPGKEFAPSIFARQESTRGHGSIAWSGKLAGGKGNVAGYMNLDGSLYRDPNPPMGLPLDARTRVITAGTRSDVIWEPIIEWIPEISLGAITSFQMVNSGSLSNSAPTSRESVSASARGSLTPVGPHTKIELTAAGHWDGLAERWRSTHDVTVTFGRPGLHFYVAQRSSFSLPTLGDQFFNEGIAIAPNPNLRAERVPWEIESGIEIRSKPGRVFWGGGGSIYRGDIIDMIVWAPDFRFVWAPRNVNVNRWGIDVWSEAKLSLSTHLLSISANYSMVKVTYDRPEPVPVQVMYRPRHSGAGSLGFTWGKWEGQAGVKFIGSRLPVAFHVNRLPAFWTTELRLAKHGLVADKNYQFSIQVNRLFNHKDNLIFGYPHPGRTLDVKISFDTGCVN